MDRRRFIACAAALPVAGHAAVLGSPSSTSPVAVPAGHAASIATEPMMVRYKLTLDRVLHGTGPAYNPDFLLEDIRATPGRRFTQFSGDVSGRWIGALATASAFYGQSFPLLDDVVLRAIALQHPEGYFGKSFNFDQPNDDDLALLWGNGRLLVGLMEYYALTYNPAVLASAAKLGDFLLRIAPAFNSSKMAEEFSAVHFASSYICWTQQTEGLAALYVVTKDPRYRDLCEAISQRIERRPADHVHGFLCSLRGTVDLYIATKDEADLRRVEAAWQDIMSSGDVLVTGGVPEAWTPKKKRTEGCAECDWLRLNLSLWRATGNTSYLNTAEQVLFNEFSMNQFSTGDFGHAMLNEDGTPGIVYVRAWWCCTLHGLRAFPDVHRNVFRVASGEVFYDLPIDGRVETVDFSAQATSRLAIDGTVQIHVRSISVGQILTLRQPPWANDLQIKVNGRAVKGLKITNLRADDTLVARYAMTLGQRTVGASQRLSFFYGPWLLGAPSNANPGYFNELHADNLLIASDAKATQETATSSFDVPIAATAVPCLPAEFPDQPSNVHLRAVAEQTANYPTQWELAFAINPGKAKSGI